MKKTVREKASKQYRWFHVSYYILAATLLMILVLYSVAVLNQIRADANRNNQHYTGYYNNLIEKEIERVTDYSRTCLNLKAAQDISSYPLEDINASEFLDIAYDLIGNLRLFQESCDIVQDIYVYYPDHDLVIGAKGAFRSYTYFRAENPSSLSPENEYQQWITCFTAKPSGYYTWTDINGQSSVYFFMNMFSTSVENPRIVVSKNSREQMEQSISQYVQGGGYHYAALVDRSGNIYAQSGENASFLNEKGQFDFWESTGRYIVCQAESEQWPLSHVTIQNFNTAYRNVYRLTAILILCVGMAVVIGCALSVFFTRRNRRAVNQLASRFTSPDEPQRYSDFDYIAAEIDKLIASESSAIEAAERQQELVNSFFLREVLQQRACTTQDVERLCATYQISLENSLFTLIVVSKDRHFSDDLRKAMLDMVSAHTENNFFVFWTEFAAEIVFLCNFEAMTKLPQTPVIELARAFRTLTDAPIEISPMSDDLKAMIAFYSEQYGTQEKDHTKAPAPLRQAEGFLFQEFSAAVDQDDLTTALALVDGLQRKFLSTENEKLNLCRRYILLAKLYETYDLPQMAQELDQLYCRADSPDWGEQLVKFLQKARLEHQARQNDTRQVADIVREIICREYSNPQLSLQMLADQIGVSQSYLSRLFKEKYGSSVIHYLNQVRVEHAKKMMQTTDDNLSVIAMRCGFTSNINLIRVFKKYESVTPGSFRNQT